MSSIDAIIDLHQAKRGPLLPILHAVQEAFGFIPTDAVAIIAKRLNLSRAEVHGVISFYHDFKHEARGKNIVKICRAEACQSMGSRDLEQHAHKSLGLEYGETSEDGLITLEPVYCLGNCACSPSVSVNQKVYARVDVKRFDQIVAGLQSDDMQANKVTNSGASS